MLEQAKLEARRRGTTLTALVEQGLRLMLRRPQPGAALKRVRLPVSRAGGGTLPGVDLDDSASLIERMDGIG